MNEFARIDTFVAQFSLVQPPPFGPGDDAAVLAPRADVSCVTTDALVENVHFTRAAFSLEDIGHKALAVNLSDLAAMAAVPEWFVCALGLPTTFTPGDLKALGRGMAALAKGHGISLVGGNVTRSPVLTVTITACGTLSSHGPLLRSTARAGDQVYVSGPLGLAAAGLEALADRSKAFASLRAAQRRPAPHVSWAQAAARFATSGIDVSDGLVQDLGHVARASNKTIDLDTALIEPLLEASLVSWCGGSRAKALGYALSGGEDYVVGVTVPFERSTQFETAMAQEGYATLPVGRVVDGMGGAVTVNGKKPARRGGFQHF